MDKLDLKRSDQADQKHLRRNSSTFGDVQLVFPKSTRDIGNRWAINRSFS